MTKKVEQITWQDGNITYQAIFKENVFTSFSIQNKKKTLMVYTAAEPLSQLRDALTDLFFKLNIKEVL